MYAAVRIRGWKNVRHDVKKTLELLQLDRKNHCVLIPDKKEQVGMLEKAKDYIGFGIVKEETISALLKKRGRLEGDKKVKEEDLKEFDFNSFDEAAKAIAEGKTSLRKLGIKPVFRLNNPKGGFGKAGIKKQTTQKGPLAVHKEGIDSLIQKMM
jgi:large subunit ribosomal protein L30